MKRSSFLDLNLMRKHTRTFILAPISLAVMVGCSSDKSEQVKFVSSVDECVSSTELDLQQCEAAYQKAVKDAEETAPRYQYERDCVNEFGQCEQRGGFFIPFMAGYIVAEVIDEIGDSMERKHRYKYSHPTYLYRGSGQYRNKIMTSDGHLIGSPGQRSYNVNRNALKPKSTPTVTRTMSRGGFGAKASAKSNWGSSKSSGSRGWGG